MFQPCQGHCQQAPCLTIFEFTAIWKNKDVDPRGMDRHLWQVMSGWDRLTHLQPADLLGLLISGRSELDRMRVPPFNACCQFASVNWTWNLQTWNVSALLQHREDIQVTNSHSHHFVQGVCALTWPFKHNLDRDFPTIPTPKFFEAWRHVSTENLKTCLKACGLSSATCRFGSFPSSLATPALTWNCLPFIGLSCSVQSFWWHGRTKIIKKWASNALRRWHLLL